MKSVVLQFATMHNLDIDEVFCVGLHGSKLPVLLAEGAIRHYDDSPDIEHELQGSDIELVKVPRTPEVSLDQLDLWLARIDEDLLSLPGELKQQFHKVYEDWEEYGNEENWLNAFYEADISSWQLKEIPLPTDGFNFKATSPEEAAIWMKANDYDFDYDHHAAGPIIVLEHPNGSAFAIDGVHRVAMAWAAGDKTIMAWVGKES
jgi:hypothetical protein